MDFEEYLFSEADKYFIKIGRKFCEWSSKEIVSSDVDYSILKYTDDENNEYYLRIVHGDRFFVVPTSKGAF